MPPTYPRTGLRAALLAVLLPLAACGASRAPESPGPTARHAGDTPEMQAMIHRYASFLEIPPDLLSHVIAVESGYNPQARNGSYYGLMQIAPQTARTMGYDGPDSGLLDPETNLRFAGAYLRGAYIVANGDPERAYDWYRKGYYYEARDRSLLVETGLAKRELR
ncbi:transglycosylase SLT domain-containing protein [Rubellimicrobium aerolatum]|uniref:Transglycosylase SLT domain-containing protein n=1 Tax=Rubellimicrobium aerolatum TaxID=490979 RepID=A0ABW0SC58_9RHOB|nr:transglycosylase SLT domain-containing protein [Rubellimicrobium aerolatum]MBP1806029.1 soluble lytic murein transglycosylase-like protein [Rubellimicrobium aerolatum]